jgi:hypothetical protein
MRGLRSAVISSVARDLVARVARRPAAQVPRYARDDDSTPSDHVRSTTVAFGAFVFTDSIPFSIADVEEYVSLVPIT